MPPTAANQYPVSRATDYSFQNFEVRGHMNTCDLWAFSCHHKLHIKENYHHYSYHGHRALFSLLLCHMTPDPAAGSTKFRTGAMGRVAFDTAVLSPRLMLRRALKP